MTINLTQIRADFDNGIIVSKQTLLALVEYASELEKERALIYEVAAQACDQQADGTNGPYRSACLNCADALRDLRYEKANHAL